MRIYRTPTEVSPEVDMNLRRGWLKINGVSSMAECRRFYSPIIDMVRDPHPRLATLQVDLKFEKLDGPSYDCVFELLKEIKQLESKAVSVNLNWHVDNNHWEVQGYGEGFQDRLDLNMNFVELGSLRNY